MEKQASMIDESKAIVPVIAKSLIIGLASLLPDWFPLHAHVAFAFGLIGGFIIQHFIPPRGRHFWLLFAVVLVAIAMYAVFN